MSKWGVSLNATLSEEQMDEIASKTADKVLSSRSYSEKENSFLQSEIGRIKSRNRELEKMVVQREIIIDRYKTSLERRKEERDELYSIALWGARRMPTRQYGVYMYDEIEKVTGEEINRDWRGEQV